MHDGMTLISDLLYTCPDGDWRRMHQVICADAYFQMCYVVPVTYLRENTSLVCDMR